jgi:hypothetical protein
MMDACTTQARIRLNQSDPSQKSVWFDGAIGRLFSLLSLPPFAGGKRLIFQATSTPSWNSIVSSATTQTNPKPPSDWTPQADGIWVGIPENP